MLPLFLVLHIFIGTTLAGSSVIAVLTMGYTGGRTVAVAALVGFLISFPVSWLVAKRLMSSKT